MPFKRSYKKKTYRKNYNKNYNNNQNYRNNVANQIQLAVPRPLKSQLVRMTFRNSVYLKPALIDGVQPSLGFTVNVNQPHNILYNSTFVQPPNAQQEIWTSALATGGAVQHLGTWTQKYNKYLVRGAKVSITFRTEGNSVPTDRSGKICLIRHGGDDDIDRYSTWNSIQNTNQSTRVGNVTPSTSTTNQVRLSMGYSPSRSSAISKSALTANPDMVGDIETSTYVGPTEDEFISLAYVSPFQAATTGAYTMPEGLCELSVDYLVQFMDPKQNTEPQPEMV